MSGRSVLAVAAIWATTVAAQCARQNTPDVAQGGGASDAVGTPAMEQDSARVARLEREARALADTRGCDDVGQCRSAPVGERPCGGPRDYVVYCARTTDSAALHRKLAELRQAEIELNRKTGAMSTCEFRAPPHVALSGGSCVAH